MDKVNRPKSSLMDLYLHQATVSALDLGFDVFVILCEFSASLHVALRFEIVGLGTEGKCAAKLQ